MTTEIPSYETLSSQFKAVLGLDPNARVRFLQNWQDYFRAQDDPNRKERLRQGFEDIVAGTGKGQRVKTNYEKVPPNEVEAVKHLTNLDETLMWSPRNLQEYVLSLIREYDTEPLRHLNPSDRQSQLEVQLRDVYEAQKRKRTTNSY